MAAVLERRANGVFVIWLSNGEENRLTVELLDAVTNAWLEAERDGARVIVTASRTRFYSNGVELRGDGSAARAQEVLERLVRLVRLIAGSGVPSVALLSGHAVGGGLMLALAHDWRVARRDKGLFFVPAVDLGIRLPAPLLRLAVARLGTGNASRLLLSRERFNGAAAAALGVVDQLVDGADEAALFACAEARARDVGQRDTYAYVKSHVLAGRNEGAAKL
jgi:enoyl-CoA hydratase/carnithine racemase